MAIKCLTIEQQENLCEEYLQNKFLSASELSKKYKVSRTTIRTIFRNRDISIEEIRLDRKYTKSKQTGLLKE